MSDIDDTSAAAAAGHTQGRHTFGHDAGGGGEKGTPFCHNPHYDFNDDIIALGASYWVELARHYLAAAN